jgi:iron complex outermembrane receptor protein
LQAGLSLLDTEVTDAGDSANFFAGAELASSPSFSFNLLASQEYALDNGNLLTLTGNIAHTGKQVKATATNGNNNVIDQLSVDAYTLLNANISYRFGQAQQYNLSLYGKNLSDENFCGGVLINDGNAILGNTVNARSAMHMNALCRVTSASTRTIGASISVDF